MLCSFHVRSSRSSSSKGETEAKGQRKSKGKSNDTECQNAEESRGTKRPADEQAGEAKEEKENCPPNTAEPASKKQAKVPLYVSS